MISDVDDDGRGTAEFVELPRMMTHKFLCWDPTDEIAMGLWLAVVGGSWW